MSKAHFAERILALFTNQERAASMAGDLMESARVRSPIWFWADVFRTALSLLWKDFSADPSFMAGLAFRGLLVNLFFMFVMFIGIFVSYSLLGLIVAMAGFRGMPYSWVGWLCGGVTMWAVQFQTGRWLARRARGKEMAACVAFLIVETIVMRIVGEAVFGGQWGRSLVNSSASMRVPDITRATILIENLVGTIVLFGGAIWFRRRQGVLKKNTAPLV